jgi:hypothetical protein
MNVFFENISVHNKLLKTQIHLNVLHISIRNFRKRKEND